MVPARRTALLTLLASALVTAQFQDPANPRHDRSLPPDPNEDQKLPNGKSMKIEMAKKAHQDALNEADELISAAQALRNELDKAGDYVVPLSSVKRTEEIEKLARRIRGHLKQ